MCTTPILASPKSIKTFGEESDASSTGIGVVLTQYGLPLEFAIQALSGRNLGRSTCEKEMMTIFNGVPT